MHSELPTPHKRLKRSHTLPFTPGLSPHTLLAPIHRARLRDDIREDVSWLDDSYVPYLILEKSADNITNLGCGEPSLDPWNAARLDRRARGIQHCRPCSLCLLLAARCACCACCFLLAASAAHCLLLTACCLLPAAYCSLRSHAYLALTPRCPPHRNPLLSLQRGGKLVPHIHPAKLRAPPTVSGVSSKQSVQAKSTCLLSISISAGGYFSTALTALLTVSSDPRWQVDPLPHRA